MNNGYLPTNKPIDPLAGNTQEMIVALNRVRLDLMWETSLCIKYKDFKTLGPSLVLTLHTDLFKDAMLDPYVQIILRFKRLGHISDQQMRETMVRAIAQLQFKLGEHVREQLKPESLVTYDESSDPLSD